MQPLPALTAGTTRWVLPMADRSAVALAEWLLAPEPPAASVALAPVLASDPPLTVWAVCVAWRHSRLQPRGIHELADWLAEHVLEVLQWDAADLHTPGISDDRHTTIYANRVEATLRLAHLAAVEDEAFLLSLLDHAGDWPDMAGDCKDEAIAAILPEWLIKRWAETSLPESAKNGAGPVEPIAEDRGRQWAMWHDAAAWLPQIAAKAGRLNQLEFAFHETLEIEKLEAMAEFAAGAGHEINNPLTVIAGRAQLFLHEESDPERRRALALISAQAMRVYEMIADMMLFARPPRPELQTVEVVGMIDALVAELLPRATRQETTFCRTVNPQPVFIQADPVQLQVALRAICQNAFEALGSGGRVEIDAEKGAGVFISQKQRLPTPFVAIRIRDDGPGITSEERRHIFDPFYSARQAGRGLGMGLAKAWRIIANHGGRIDVASLPGHGAAFTITLPAGAGKNDAAPV
jgi:hypothetical protein